MKNSVLVIFIFLTYSGVSQTCLSEMYPYDTLYTMRYFDRDIKSSMAALYKNELWLYTPTLRENDTLYFQVFNLDRRTVEQKTVYVPSLSFKVHYPDSRAFAVNDKNCVLYFHGVVLVLKRKHNGLLFETIFPINEGVEFMHLSAGQKLKLGKAYNFHPLSQPTKTFAGIYDLKSQKFDNYINPEISGIEFTHFSPRQHIAFSDRFTVSADILTYSVKVYDNKNYGFKDSAILYRNIDSFGLNVHQKIWYEKYRTISNTKTLIDSLSEIEDNVARIEWVGFVNDTMLLVRHIPHHQKAKSRVRYYDVWLFSNNKWMLSQTDIVDGLPNINSYHKRNMPVLSSQSTILVNDRFLVVLSKGTDIDFLNLNQQLVKEKEDEYYKEKYPCIRMDIHKKH